MSGLVPIKELFEAVYGVNLELLNLQLCDSHDPNSIRFISRKEGDNGLAAYVKRIENIIPNPAHTISVAVSGSVLSSFYQDQEYYSGRDIYYLRPKTQISVEQMLFYAFCIKANKYKYNYGRGANRTLKDILIPEEVPAEFKSIKINQIPVPDERPLHAEMGGFNVASWQPYEISELFVIRKGKRLTKEDMEPGITPFVAAIDANNGWRDFISLPALHSGGTISVNYNGSVAEAFYQPLPFWASDDVNVLYAKFEMNIYHALFIATVITKEKYRFNYGRKWHAERMAKSFISLPSRNGKPDFTLMENYIKSLPYSTALSTEIKMLSVKQKTKKPIKGMSDEQLIKKYEFGKVQLNLDLMLDQPSMASSKSGKQKIKR